MTNDNDRANEPSLANCMCTLSKPRVGLLVFGLLGFPIHSEKFSDRKTYLSLGCAWPIYARSWFVREEKWVCENNLNQICPSQVCLSHEKTNFGAKVRVISVESLCHVGVLCKRTPHLQWANVFSFLGLGRSGTMLSADTGQKETREILLVHASVTF